jgi:hypothetical protein
MGYHGRPVLTAWADRYDELSVRMQEAPLS